MMTPRSELEPNLLESLRAAIEPDEVIRTIGRGQPNRVISIDPEGLLIETERSQRRGSGPQLVPASMIQTGFDELTRVGSLTQGHLLNDLNVKRSAAVCALLARLPEVEVLSERPVRLGLRSQLSAPADSTTAVVPRLGGPAMVRSTFILTWNPNNWDFSDGEYEDHVATTVRGELVNGRWSTGVRTSGIAPGDRAFLLRQHEDRGIVAAGEFCSEIVQDEHWDGSDGFANFADVRWETFLPIRDRLPVEDLKRMVDAAWDRMQGSGVKLRDNAADDLDELWNEHLLAVGRAIE